MVSKMDLRYDIGRLDDRIGKWIEGSMVTLKERWTDGWRDGRMDEWREIRIE